MCGLVIFAGLASCQKINFVTKDGRQHMQLRLGLRWVILAETLPEYVRIPLVLWGLMLNIAWSHVFQPARKILYRCYSNALAWAPSTDHAVELCLVDLPTLQACFSSHSSSLSWELGPLCQRSLSHHSTSQCPCNSWQQPPRWLHTPCTSCSGSKEHECLMRPDSWSQPLNFHPLPPALDATWQKHPMPLSWSCAWCPEWVAPAFNWGQIPRAELLARMGVLLGTLGLNLGQTPRAELLATMGILLGTFMLPQHLWRQQQLWSLKTQIPLWKVKFQEQSFWPF